MCGTDCFLFCLSILFPPIGVWVKRGICSADSLINLALCCLGFLPGLLHAWYIILKYPDPYDSYTRVDGDTEGSRTVTYYYIAQGEAQGRQHRVPQQCYGTVSAQPTAGQFPGQQGGTANAFKQQEGPRRVEGAGESSSAVPEEHPPAYTDVIRGDHKVQTP